jgi:sugar/nucleoside kinase (ribokinase family)
MQQYDVVGIGNAIVDIIGRCDEAFLTKHGCAKGSMQLVDAAAVAKLYGDMGPAVEISGGSGANTIVGVERLASSARQRTTSSARSSATTFALPA